MRRRNSSTRGGSMDLAKFLNDRLDEAAAAANAVIDAEGENYEATWFEQSSGVLYVGPGSVEHPLDGLQPMGDSRLTRFIAEHDPARVLRQVDAKRKILNEHSPLHWHPDSPLRCRRCTSVTIDGKMAKLEWPCAAVRAVAAVWSDHPDFDPAWKE